MALESEFYGPNLGYILELYDRYQNDPDSVDFATRKFFETWSPPKIAVPTPSTLDLVPLTGAANLAQAIREVAVEKAKAGQLKHRDSDQPVSAEEIEHALGDMRHLTESGIA